MRGWASDGARVSDGVEMEARACGRRENPGAGAVITREGGEDAGSDSALPRGRCGR